MARAARLAREKSEIAKYEEQAVLIHFPVAVSTYGDMSRRASQFVDAPGRSYAGQYPHRDLPFSTRTNSPSGGYGIFGVC